MPQHALHTVLLAALYALTGKAGLFLAAQTEFATVIWPPSGIALGMLLVYGYRVWPGVLIGSMMINGHLAGTFESWETVLGAKGLGTLITGCGAALQAVAGRYLILKIFDFPLQIEKGRDAFSFLLVAGPVSCLISATVGTAVLYYFMGLPAEQSITNWMAWWAGDTFGVLAFMPLILIICSNIDKKFSGKERGLSPLPMGALLAVVLSIAATLTAWKVMIVHLEHKNQDLFESRVDEAQRALFYRLSSYQSGLLGGAGFFAGSSYVDLKEWKAFVRSAEIEKNYVGINGIGFIVPVDREALDDYVASQRANGRPDFDVRPDRNAENFFIIQYIEPQEINAEAVGLNIAFEKSRLEAAIRARDIGKPSITKKIVLVHDAQKKPGFLLLHPVYHNDMPLDTVEERRAALHGWIYAPFTARDFFESAGGKGDSSDMFLQVYDGDVVGAKDLIYSNRAVYSAQKSLYAIKNMVEVLGQKWTLVWSSAPKLEHRIISNEPFVILFSGMAFTSLLSMFLIVISQRTEVVKREVDRKTRQFVASEGRMRMLVRHTPAAVAMFDQNMRYIMTSERWVRDYNLFGKEILGRSHYDIFPEIKLMPEWMEHHKRALAGESLSREEDVWQRADGRTEWLRWALHPWRDEKGNIGGIVMFTEIITDAKNSKAELLRSNAALEEFAYVVSHDLKAPLRHISMCASFFEESLQNQLDDESRKLLNIMRDSSEKMRIMIESLLDYSRIGRSAGEYKLVDLNQVLADALVALTPQIESCGAVVQAETLPSVRGSQTEMTRVFQNLVENAIKYRKEGVAPVVKVKSYKRDGSWEISIADNGIGIDPKFASKIFQLFQRLHGEDSAYTGAGIGLSVCQRIIHYHGGQLWLDTDYNEGCRFIFTLPDYQARQT